MTRTMRRVLVVPIVLLVFSLAACEDASTPSGFATPRQTAGGVTRTEAIDCPTVTTGEAALEPVGVPPEPEDPPGAGGEEDELNEGQAPPIPDAPNAVIPDPLALGRAATGPRGAQGDPQPDDLIIYAGWPTNPITSGANHQTAEPEVAMKDNRVLMTWNKMAARSLNGGRTWDFLPPATSFPRVDGGFCCDQRAIHVERQDIWLWVLQYESGPDENNTIRLAWAAGDEAFDAARFHYADWRAVDVGFDPGTFFDQPKLGVSEEHFFLSINGFVGGDFVSAIVIRGRLDDLVAGSAPTTSCLVPSDPRTNRRLFGPYPIRKAANTMYIAAHVSTAELGVWSWPDSSGSPTFVGIQSRTADDQEIKFPLNTPYACRREGGGSASDWCFRPVRDAPEKFGNDARITSGWLGGGTVGFAWNASQGGGWNYPFVWAIVIDAGGIDACARGDCILGWPIIYDQDYAYQYAAISSNEVGALGAVALTGGGDEYLGCRVLAREGFSSQVGWDWVKVGTSRTDMPTPNSGDYLGIGPDGESTNAWAGACMTYDPLEGGTVIHFVRFGRRIDAP